MMGLSSRFAARTFGLMAAASAAVGLGNLAPIPSAHADPGFLTSVVGVGADTDQNLFDAYAGEEPPGTGTTIFYTPVSSGASSDNWTISSFDANPAGGTTTAPGCVTTKLGGPAFDRPNSTTNGITALSDEVSGSLWENPTASQSCTGAGVNVVGEIDFARAARGPKTTGTTLTFIPFARDAIAVAYYDHDTGNLATLTTAQLASLYSSASGEITVGTDTVEACAPISSSAVLTNFETAIGVTSAQATTATTASGCNNLTQNSGNAFYSAVSSLPSGTDAVIPFSAAAWISQANQLALDVSATARSAGVSLTDISGLGLPYTGTVPTLAPNSPYYQSGAYGVTLYDVVPTSKISGVLASNILKGLFVGSTSALCSTPAQTLANQFGEDSLTTSEGTCGSTSTAGDS
jgi:hypothetical protein